MGQYYYVVNVDKKQYIHPHRFGDGMKLLEFGASSDGTMLALALLLADGNGRGGGDHRSRDPVIGSWSGDRVVVAGQYADRDRFTNDPARNLFKVAQDDYEDISSRLVELVRSTDG